MAKNAGIELDVLEREVSYNEIKQSESNFNPTNIKGRSAPSWFNDNDDDFNAQLKSNLDGGGSNNDSDNDSNSSSNDDGYNMEDGIDKPTIVNGKLVINDRTLSNGIRVGSAGGWSLEVFPGDFVVHYKYGIGRYDQTIVKPKKKLTNEEIKAQKIRRDDIVKELLARREKEGEKGLTNTEIENIVRNFGTEQDLDPVSNPMQTVLEVAYNDAVVHIPVDKAYRLSRYRAGDAVVKPRLSRVKGETWRKAKRKVEEDTIQMAQDVLALYATRETLTRKPFDPAKEGMLLCYYCLIHSFIHYHQ